MEPRECQMPSLRTLAEGNAEAVSAPLTRRLKLAIRRRLTPSQERSVKLQTDRLRERLMSLAGRPRPVPLTKTNGPIVRLKAGDWVRVRSREEIEATLNSWRQLRGCAFMREMLPYCGTVQRVLKPMERFVDERDLRAKKSRGIVLLEGVNCGGTAEFGRCDRNCFVFWREEWLEKIDRDASEVGGRNAENQAPGDRSTG